MPRLISSSQERVQVRFQNYVSWQNRYCLSRRLTWPKDHQTKNARAIVDRQGAVMLKESELDAKFEQTISGLIASKAMQTRLSNAIKKLALPNATLAIVDEIEKVMKNQEHV